LKIAGKRREERVQGTRAWKFEMVSVVLWFQRKLWLTDATFFVEWKKWKSNKEGFWFEDYREGWNVIAIRTGPAMHQCESGDDGDSAGGLDDGGVRAGWEVAGNPSGGAASWASVGKVARGHRRGEVRDWLSGW
jgi:hypothetical protein